MGSDSSYLYLHNRIHHTHCTGIVSGEKKSLGVHGEWRTYDQNRFRSRRPWLSQDLRCRVCSRELVLKWKRVSGCLITLSIARTKIKERGKADCSLWCDRFESHGQPRKNEWTMQKNEKPTQKSELTSIHSSCSNTGGGPLPTVLVAKLLASASTRVSRVRPAS
ncbi:hypothetical protein BDP27DRAFT_247220 [Rhodocollybia butyracea]|uniref:Uncharacterized protein n=1 Tax=Rhodocollybia butyracea TaxID=206335 RepID=A0A9P5UDC0_9AGAR|nr:hypothetical protein BDP27DRAFT_247220 [Rhodocollybia butyracea]